MLNFFPQILAQTISGAEIIMCARLLMRKRCQLKTYFGRRELSEGIEEVVMQIWAPGIEINVKEQAVHQQFRCSVNTLSLPLIK